MTATLTPLSPADLAGRLKSGRALLVDIREPDEYAREHIRGAVAAPLSTFEKAHLHLEPERDVIFMCRTGNRTGSNCDRLAGRIDGAAWVLDGGLDAWKAAGLPVVTDRSAPLEMFRQVQIGAGSLILLGAALGLFVHPGFFALSALVGAGLLTAGITGFCGMAKVLAVAPWNRTTAA